MLYLGLDKHVNYLKRLHTISDQHAGVRVLNGQLLLPFGLPSRFTSAIHFGGRPRRFPRPYAIRWSTAMASAN